MQRAIINSRFAALQRLRQLTEILRTCSLGIGDRHTLVLDAAPTYAATETSAWGDRAYETSIHDYYKNGDLLGRLTRQTPGGLGSGPGEGPGGGKGPICGDATPVPVPPGPTHPPKPAPDPPTVPPPHEPVPVGPPLPGPDVPLPPFPEPNQNRRRHVRRAGRTDGEDQLLRHATCARDLLPWDGWLLSP